MAWEEELFGYLEDLEAQAAAQYDAERAGELADRSRAEYQQVTLASRLAASVDHELTLELAGVGTVTGSLARIATGWCLLHQHGQDWVVRLAAVAAVHGASERALPEVAWPAVAKLGLGAPLRRLADAAEPCSLLTVDGTQHDGTVTRVGADFVELRSGSRSVLVALERLAAVRSRAF